MSATPRRLRLAPWLLLALWARLSTTLRGLFEVLVRRPFMRLTLGDQLARLADEAALPPAEDDHVADGRQLTIDELPLGLANLGNLCFVNAVVQCLRVLPGFVDRLVDATAAARTLALTGDDKATARQWHMADALCDLLDGVAPERHGAEKQEGQDVLLGRSIVKESDPDARAEQNVALLRNFRRAASECSYLVAATGVHQEQQDAEEFLSWLLELLHELFRRRESPPDDNDVLEFERYEMRFTDSLRAYSPNDPTSYTTAVTNLGTLRWNRYLQQNASMITDLFCGQVVRGSQCSSCASLTCLHEEQRVVALTVDPTKSEQSVIESLKRYAVPEQLTDDNRVFCNGFCQTRTGRLTQALLQRTPSTLILQLQRFQQVRAGGLLEKVDADVRFPWRSNEQLDVTTNAFNRDEARPVLYRLVAVCSHVGGSINAGHYIAYVRGTSESLDEDRNSDGRASSDQWIRIDDDFVSVIDDAIFEHETLSTAYLLFYTRVEASSPVEQEQATVAEET